MDPLSHIAVVYKQAIIPDYTNGFVSHFSWELYPWKVRLCTQARLESLQTLEIFNCKAVSQLPSRFAKITQLQSLTLRGGLPLLTNNYMLHSIGELTNLTRLQIGPWEGTNFPISLQQLVEMKEFRLQVMSDTTQELQDPVVYQKIAWIVSCMPKLKELYLCRGTYGYGHSVALNPQRRDLSLTLLSLRAHPRILLQSCELYSVPIMIDMIHMPYRHKFRKHIGSFACECGFPSEYGALSDHEILDEWRLSVDKILAFMQATHPRLGVAAPYRNMLPELSQRIAAHSVYRADFDHMVRGIADLWTCPDIQTKIIWCHIRYFAYHKGPIGTCFPLLSYDLVSNSFGLEETTTSTHVYTKFEVRHFLTSNWEISLDHVNTCLRV